MIVHSEVYAVVYRDEGYIEHIEMLFAREQDAIEKAASYQKQDDEEGFNSLFTVRKMNIYV